MRVCQSQWKALQLLFPLSWFIFSCFLTSCAASDISRDAASNVDTGVQNAKNLTYNEGDMPDAYQNARQATKGAILGGVAGGVTGYLVSGIGVLPGTAVGAIMGASYGSYIDAHTTLKDQLENRGVTVIVLGDQILISIPSSRLFYPMTSNIKPRAYSTLQLVAQYINQYTKMLVRVAAYTDNIDTRPVLRGLSEQQAEKVSKALLADGIDARLLYAAGRANEKLMERSKPSMWDGNDNYRVEITLEKLYV